MPPGRTGGLLREWSGIEQGYGTVLDAGAIRAGLQARRHACVDPSRSVAAMVVEVED